MGLEACMTLGTLSESQAQRLANAGLDYYNHNLDTSPEFYGNIITTRTYQERLDTLEKVRDAGIKVCSGGIVGLGETVKDRAGLLLQL
ncbi:radical SAM protein, partial [Xanthomonas citri pv. citri]|nr:radical SAM protein [Xanthomonas citri pv. citri]